MHKLPEQNYSHKQVIVVRKDLGMRKGKMAAQAAHASTASALPRETANITEMGNGKVQISWELDVAQLEWFMGLSTKIVVGARDEQHLMEIYEQAKQAGLPCSLIQDRGFTEFGGVPTYTAVGIGPANEQLINTITGALPLM